MNDFMLSLQGQTIRCQRCGKILDHNDIVWLDLDLRDSTYHDIPLPEEFSQGGFPFGKACAKTVLKNNGKIK